MTKSLYNLIFKTCPIYTFTHFSMCKTTDIWCISGWNVRPENQCNVFPDTLMKHFLVMSHKKRKLGLDVDVSYHKRLPRGLKM